jgi:hypothetical protein
VLERPAPRVCRDARPVLVVAHEELHAQLLAHDLGEARVSIDARDGASDARQDLALEQRDSLRVTRRERDAPREIDERERLYQEFREGTTPVLVVSKVANFSVDLPEATVAIQVSGSFGSRQEEAQRLGRLLRPKESGLPANFYTLVARDTVDQDFAQNRQRFLAEQGYSYTILDASSLVA